MHVVRNLLYCFVIAMHVDHLIAAPSLVGLGLVAVLVVAMFSNLEGPTG